MIVEDISRKIIMIFFTPDNLLWMYLIFLPLNYTLVEVISLPQRLQDAKIHQEMIDKDLNLVLLCVFVPWWQKP